MVVTYNVIERTAVPLSRKSSMSSTGIVQITGGAADHWQIWFIKPPTGKVVDLTLIYLKSSQVASYSWQFFICEIKSQQDIIDHYEAGNFPGDAEQFGNIPTCRKILGFDAISYEVIDRQITAGAVRLLPGQMLMINTTGVSVLNKYYSVGITFTDVTKEHYAQ